MAEVPPASSDVLRAARRRSASLAYTDRPDPAPAALSCPYSSGRVVVELHSGSVYPDRCRSNRCTYCLPLNARRRCLAITAVGPQRMIRLSKVAEADTEDPSTMATVRIKRIRRNLQRVGLSPGEWCWTIEKNPKGTGYHAHCLQTGPSIPQADLQIACTKAHAGIPYINAIKRTGRWTSQYGMKGFGADGYGMKTFRPNADTKESLRINGGKVEHHSVGFFTIAERIYTVREAERLAIAEMNEGKQIAFIGCHPNNVDRMLGDRELRYALIRDLDRRSAIRLQGLA